MCLGCFVFGSQRLRFPNLPDGVIRLMPTLHHPECFMRQWLTLWHCYGYWIKTVCIGYTPHTLYMCMSTGRTCSAVGQNRFKVHFCLFQCCGFLRRLNKKAGDLGSKKQLPNSPLWMTGLRGRSAHTARSY